MGNPFDFLGGIGQGIQGAENQIGNWVKNLLPSQPAQSQNKPLAAPPVTVPSSLQGMAPTGGAPVSRPMNMGSRMMTQPVQAPSQNWGQQFGQFAQDTGLTQLGSDILSRGKNVSDQLGAARDIAGQDLAQDIQGAPAPIQHLIGVQNAGDAQRVGKLVTNPFGYAADVLNAGVVNPIALAAKPEMWFAEDANGPGAQPITGVEYQNIISGRGHNYLRDIFAPAVKAVTGENVPHTSLYYQNQAKELTDQANKLDQAKQQIDSNPNATQQDKDAWDGAHAALSTKIDQYQTESAQSANWWANSNTSKILGLAGQVATFPAGFAAGFVTFFPQLLSSPTGTIESMIAQVKQAADFASALNDPSKRDNMSAEELASNISNIAMLGGMLFGAKQMVGREGLKRNVRDLTLYDTRQKLMGGDTYAQQKLIEALQKNVPENVNPPGSPVDHVAEADKIAQQLGPATQEHAPRIAELEQHISDLMFERRKLSNTADDLILKKSLSEEAAAARDEINNLKSQPRAMERVATQRGQIPVNLQERIVHELNIDQQDVQEYFNTPNNFLDPVRLEEKEGLLDEWLYNTRAASRSEIDAVRNQIAEIQMIRQERGAPGSTSGDVVPTEETGMLRAQRNAQVSSDIARETQTEQTPRFTKPVTPENPYPDYSQATQLGKNYPDLKPDESKFSLNAAERGPLPLRFEDDEATMLAKLEDMGHAVTNTNFVEGNGWFTPEGKGIALPQSDKSTSAHSDFFGAIKPSSDERTDAQVERDMLESGYTKITSQAGGKDFSINRFDPQNLELIQENIKHDMLGGVRPWPFVIRTAERSYRISPADMVTNDYDLAAVIRKQDLFPMGAAEMYAGMRAPAPTLDEVKGLLGNLQKDMGPNGPRVVRGSQVRTGTWFPDGTGVDATMGDAQSLMRTLSRYGNYPPEALKEASRHWVSVDRQGDTMILHADEFGQIAMKTIEDNLNDMPARLAPERVVVETTRPYRAADSPYGPAYDFTFKEFLDNDGQLMGLKTPLAGPRTGLSAGEKAPAPEKTLTAPKVITPQHIKQAVDWMRATAGGAKIQKDGGKVEYGWLLPDGSGIDIGGQSAHFDVQEGLYNVLGENSKTIPLIKNTMKTWIQIRHDLDNASVDTHYIYAPTWNNKTRDLVETYLMKRLANGTLRDSSSLIVEDGLHYLGSRTGPSYDTTAGDFKNNDFKLEGLRAGRVPERSDLYAGESNAKSTQTTQAVADRQAGQTSQAGQAGEGYHPTQASELPPGIPAGSTLTAVKQEEGQRPFAVWKVGTEPSTPLQQSIWTEHLNAQIKETFGSILPYDKIMALIADRKKIDVVQRQRDIENTLAARASQHDYFGQVKHLVFDTNLKTDASFFNDTGVVTVNPYRMFPVSFLRAMKVELLNTVSSYKGYIPPQGMNKAMTWIDSVSRMSQDDMDYKILSEEVFHANDVDGHDWRSYIEGLDRSLPPAYWDVVDRVLAGDTPGGVKFWDASIAKELIVRDSTGEPITNWSTAIRYAIEGKLDPVNDSLVGSMLAELRANALMVHAGVPGTDFTFRVKEAMINELGNPNLIRGHATATGETFPSYAQTEVAPRLAQQGRLAEPQAQPTGVTGNAAVAGDQGAPTTTAPGTNAAVQGATGTGLPGRDTRDQAQLAAGERPIGKDVDVQQLVNLGRTGYEGNWRDFAMAVVRPDLPSFENVAGYFNKLTPADQATWLKVGGVELAREEQYGPPLDVAPAPENIESPMFQARMARIKAARTEIARSGKILDDMARVGRPQVEIDAKKAHVAAIRKYSELPATMGEKEANQIATAAGQAELEALTKLRDVKRGGVTYREPTAPRDLQETEAIQGKRTNKIPTKFANFIAGRLNLHGYRDPENIEKFFASLWAGDKAAMKEYKQLTGLARDAIKEYTGFDGKADVSKAVGSVSRSRVKVRTEKAPYVGDEIGEAGGTQINPVDSTGLKTAVQNADVVHVRNGETGYNVEGKIRSTVDVPLNRTGIAQANRAAWAFRGQKVGIIVTSPLERAYKTAAAIAKVTGAKVVVDENMRPWDLGDKKGTDAAAFKPAMQDYIHNKPDEPVEGGESWNQFKNRYLTAYQSQLAKYAGKGKVVFIDHDSTARLAEDYHNAGEDASKMDYKASDSPTEVGPGGLLSLQNQGGRYVVTNKVSQGAGTMDEALGRATAARTEVKEATSTPLEQAAQKSRVQIKRAAQAEAATQAVKGEIAPQLDIEARMDTVSLDPTHPALHEALRAKDAQNKVTGGKALGIPAGKLKEFQMDYAQKLETFAQKLATIEEAATKVAEASQAPVRDRGAWNKSFRIAQELRKEIDAGADRNEVAVKAAKAMGMTLKDARAALKDHKASVPGKTLSWAPAFKDLLEGPAAEFVRGERLKHTSSKTILPGISKEEIMGADVPLSKKEFQAQQEASGEQQAFRQTAQETGAPVSPVRNRPQSLEEIMRQNAEERATKEAQGVQPPKPKRKPIAVTPAIVNTLKASVPKEAVPKEEPGHVTRVRVKKKVETEGKTTKSTAELRDEVEQVHEQINTPSPNPFVQPPPAPKRVVVKKGSKGGPPDEPPPEDPDGEGAPEEEPDSAGGGPKPPGNILDGLNESRDEARAHPNLEPLANRMHTFLTEFAKRTDPGKNQQDVVEWAKSIGSNEMADLHRGDFIQKEIERLIPGNDLERNRMFHPAIENKDELTRQAYMKENNFSPEDTALANLLHTHWEVMGRVATQADRQLFEVQQEHYLPHMLKFNEFGKATKDSNGVSKNNSPRLKAWMDRKLDSETGRPLYENIASLVEEFGADKVEERVSTLFGAHVTSMAHLARTKEMLDDFSGAYVDPVTKIAPIAAFEERSRTGGIGSGGRGLKKGAARYSGRVIVPAADLKNVPAAFRDQLVPIRVGPMRVALKNYLIYAPLADHFERLAQPLEGASLLDKAAGVAGKTNAIYKFAKFAYNPIHWFNVVSDIEAMMGRAGLTARPNVEGLSIRHPVTAAMQQLGLYSKIWGRVNGHLKGDSVWKPEGVIGEDGRPLEFPGEEAISQVIKGGATPPRKSAEASGIWTGQGGRVQRYTGMKAFADKMWTDTVWKGHIGLTMHLTDTMIKSYTKEMGHAPNEATFNNMVQFAALNAKYAVGYIDRADMTRDFNLLSEAVVFASKWTTTQARMSGRALPQNLPMAKWLANVGGGERYTNVLSDQMREQGHMTQEDLNFLNGQNGHLARQMMIGGSMKLLAVSALMAAVGSQMATGNVSNIWDNYQRDPTHLFDVYTGIDPVSGKDTWQHNPLFGMQQEMLLYILAAARAHNDGQGLEATLMAGPARMLNKANPVSVTSLNEATGYEIGLSALGWGDGAKIEKDKSIIAIHQALDAQGVPDLGGLEDRIIYAIRSLVPAPGFPENFGKDAQIGTKGDLSNALGPGKWLGAGDLAAALESGQWQNLAPQWAGDIAQFMTGSRQTTSLTPQKVQENNQIGASIATRDARDASIAQIHDAFAKGDFKKVGEIANQQGFDNSQLVAALFYPPAGTGGGVQYQGTTYAPSSDKPAVTLAGTERELTPAEQGEFEALKMANTKALLETISQTNDWKTGTGTSRTAMFNAYRTLTERAVSDQYAQKLGLLGGVPITNAQIGNALETAVQFHDLARSTLADNPVYQQADPTTRQKMETTYSSLGISLAHDAVFGNLVGVPIGNVAEIITNTIGVEESTKSYIQNSMFYQLAAPGEQARMVNEYTNMARTMVKADALGQGQGPRKNKVIPTVDDMMKVITYTVNVEESAKNALHGMDHYVTADPITQKNLDSKYEVLARSLAFASGPVGDPINLINQSLYADQVYYSLQNQFGGTDYLKLMAQQLSDTQASIRQTSHYTPQQISALEKAVRARFLDQNPAYAAWLKAKTNWTKNTSIGQVYNALNNSEYAAVQDMTNPSPLLSGTSWDPTSDPSQAVGLPSLGLPTG